MIKSVDAIYEDGKLVLQQPLPLPEHAHVRVIIDTDLARLYAVPTFRFNEAVKRNRGRFPEDFLFQLTSAERDALTSQIAMSKTGRGGRRTSRCSPQWAA